MTNVVRALAVLLVGIMFPACSAFAQDAERLAVPVYFSLVGQSQGIMVDVPLFGEYPHLVNILASKQGPGARTVEAVNADLSDGTVPGALTVVLEENGTDMNLGPVGSTVGALRIQLGKGAEIVTVPVKVYFAGEDYAEADLSIDQAEYLIGFLSGTLQGMAHNLGVHSDSKPSIVAHLKKVAPGLAAHSVGSLTLSGTKTTIPLFVKESLVASVSSDYGTFSDSQAALLSDVTDPGVTRVVKVGFSDGEGPDNVSGRAWALSQLVGQYAIFRQCYLVSLGKPCGMICVDQAELGANVRQGEPLMDFARLVGRKGTVKFTNASGFPVDIPFFEILERAPVR